MRYTVRKSIVEVLGRIWIPPITCAQTITLSEWDVNHMRDEDGSITRNSVERWLYLNSGDFSSIQDFHASIEDGDQTIDIPWKSEEEGMAFSDCMCQESD